MIESIPSLLILLPLQHRMIVHCSEICHCQILNGFLETRQA